MAKTITMDFETYEKEIFASKQYGASLGAAEIIGYLKSKKSYLDFFDSDLHLVPIYRWRDLLAALGRSEEIPT